MTLYCTCAKIFVEPYGRHMDRNHASFAMIRRNNPVTGVREQLVLDYLPKPYTENQKLEIQIKNPGGRSKVDPRETPFETLMREIPEEIEVRVSRKKHARLIAVIPNGDHDKYFFLIEYWSCKGTPSLGPSGVREELNSILSNLRWEPVNTLYDKLFKAHKRAFRRLAMRPDVSIPFE